MDGLSRLVQELSQTRSLPEIINLVSSAARKATGADGATFVLRDNGYCFYVDEDAIGPLWKGKCFPLSACISGWAMLNKQSVAIPDIFKDPRIPIEAYKPTFVKSLAMVPIRQNDPIGAIGNYWADQHLATGAELEKLQTIADVTSVAIQNVQLISLLEERVNDLESAHKVKDEFLMLISHELRTPMNSIMGWSEMLVAEQESGSEILKTGLESIYRNSKAQCRVIDSLLDTSNIVLGKFRIDQREADFSALVQRSVSDIKIEAAQKNIKINFNLALEHALVKGDSKRLRQMVDSLLDNAIKFSAFGSEVLVDLLQEGPSATLKVKDFGIGIEEAFRPKIFNRFSQTEKYTTRAHGGLGLGLTIAKSIVDSHQGQISVVSEGKGKGTEFRVSIPLFSAVSKEALIFSS